MRWKRKGYDIKRYIKITLIAKNFWHSYVQYGNLMPTDVKVMSQPYDHRKPLITEENNIINIHNISYF